MPLLRSGVVIILAIGIAGYAFQYLSFEKTDFLKSKDAVLTSSVLWLTAFYLHVFFGGTALLIGGFQFLERLRDKYLAVHRKLGTVYFVSVLIASLAGLALSFFAHGGIFSKAGFFALAVLWLVSVCKALAAIKQRDIVSHQMWMTRNYAFTFAAVTLRLWIPILIMAFKLDFVEAYRIVAWLCWVPNLLFAELLVYRIRVNERKQAAA
jgi:uncharacterized membrane protein